MTDEGDFDNPVYKQIEQVLSNHFSLRIVPTPECFTNCFKTANFVIYKAMQGASEFTIGGVLENWTITERLHLINVPTVVLCGQYDTMTEECSLAIVNNIPTCWPLVMIPRAGHCKLLDEPQVCVEQTMKFLNTVEASRSLGLV
jgi:L-proline amide hydrolase